MISISGKLLSESQLKLLQLSLSLRIYSPKLEMFRQIALERGVQATETKDCSFVVDVNGELSCEVDRLLELVKAATDKPKPITYNIDHQFPGGEDNKVVNLSENSNIFVLVLFFKKKDRIFNSEQLS